MAIKTDDYIKYLTQQFVAYMDTPRDMRKEQRQLQRSAREPWQVRWFGMLPLATSLWLGKWKRSEDKKGHPDPSETLDAECQDMRKEENNES